MTTPAPRSREALCAAIEAGWEPDFLFFWGHRGRKDHKIDKACLSQWWPSPFEVEGQRYLCGEHYMMAGKARLFGDDESLAAILAATEPGKMKALGRQVKGFDEDRWAAARDRIVSEGNRAKFEQNDRARYYLLGTRDRVLVEAAPNDRVWGIGLSRDDPRARTPAAWPGDNRLGFVLMQVRDELRTRD